MSTFLAAVSGLLAGLALGALLSRMYGPAPPHLPIMFALSSACALVIMIMAARSS